MRDLPSPFRCSIVLVALASTLGGCANRSAPVVSTPTAPTGPATVSPLAAAAAGRHDGGPLRRELDALFAAPATQTATWSALIQSHDTGEVLYRLNPDTLVLPASNQKVVTTAIAAERLGWDFRFDTRLEASAPVEDGVLRGDLFVVGTGDPTINAREQRRESVLDELAAALRAAGVTRVDGRLVGDDNAWDDERFGVGWQWDDLPYGYSAPLGALQYNENLVEVTITPGAVAGEAATIALAPDGSDLVLVNRVRTAAPGTQADMELSRLPGHRELIVSGVVGAGAKTVTRTAAVDNPTLFFVGALKLGLAARGVAVGGDAVDIDDLPDVPVGQRRVLARVQSPPFSEFGRTLMKVSQNLYAETMMRALSVAPGPASMPASRALAEQTLVRWGVAQGQFVVADGSGLSRMNLVSAAMVVRILRAAARDPRRFETFLATLPVAGMDGTLSGRMRGTRAEGNVRAKTGTLTGVRALSGFVTTLGGERLVFSIIANNFTGPASVVDAVVDGVMERLASLPAR